MVNEDTTGTVDGLQRQLKQLRQELLAARAVISANGGTIPRGLALEAAASASEEGEAGGKGPVSARSRAELKRTEALLRDALDRCLRLEEARGVAEAMAGNVPGDGDAAGAGANEREDGPQDEGVAGT